MQIVIDIEKKDYDRICGYSTEYIQSVFSEAEYRAVTAIRKGTPLPRGRGMTREEAIEMLKSMKCEDDETCSENQALDIAIASLTIDEKYDLEFARSEEQIKLVEKIGHCKDCKWWKDKDGVYRRGVGAKNKCPINHKEVYEGNGYCFMFESKESEVENEK